MSTTRAVVDRAEARRARRCAIPSRPTRGRAQGTRGEEAEG